MKQVRNMGDIKDDNIDNAIIILNSNSILSNVNFENSILTTETNIENVVIENCSFKNC